jgi:type IV pilus assembly protein PilW
MTLIELMVALGIGSFLMIGAMTVFMQSRTTFRINESVARLQENGRFVLDAIEPDIRMASYFGLTTRANKVQGRATENVLPAAFPVASDCNVNWAVDLDDEVEGSNNAYAWACAPNGAYQAGTDTLVVRRTAEDPTVPAALQPNTLYIQSARFQDSQLFNGTVVPAGYLPATSDAYQLVVNGYYVSQNSSLDTPGNSVPSLRRKFLRNGGSGPVIADEEILPGVDDMQIQFGVDTDLPGTANRGAIDRYVNPGAAILDPFNASFIPTARVLSVRVWIRLRAERAERGYTDTTNYVYADQNVAAPGDEFRRIVVSKTIYLRNTRPAS